MKLKLKLDKSRKKKQGYPLVVSIYVSKTDFKYPFTGYYSTLENWDFEKEEPKPIHPLYIGIMDYLLETRIKILKIINLRQNLTSDQIYYIIFGSNEDFYAFWDVRIKEMKGQGNIGNAEFQENTKNIFKKFTPKLYFKDISYNFLNNFKMYKTRTCSANTINNYLRGIRSIYNEAIRRGIFTPETYNSPFAGVMPKLTPTKNKFLTIDDMKLILNTEKKHRFYNYFMLSFLLGGIDFIDLANIKHSNIVNNRIDFTRHKGGTNERINNFIFPETWEIIKQLKEENSDYITPIHKFSYKTYRKNYNEDFRKWLEIIGVNSYFSSKSARYTFINIGKELLLNRDVIMEIVGHSKKDVHSIYEGKFPVKIKDEIHRKIIDSIIESDED